MISCFKKPCLNGGTCTIFSVCLCKTSYTGEFCETSMTPRQLIKNINTNENSICSKNMCLNGGICSKITQNIAICTCLQDFTGPFCNIEKEYLTTTSTTTTTTTTTTTSTTTTERPTIEYSSKSSISSCPVDFSHVCLNSGTCHIVSNSVLYCLCAPGYSGSFCETITHTTTAATTTTATTTIITSTHSTSTTTSPILTNKSPSCPSLFRILCQNGGTCHTPNSESGSSTYFCECLPGFSGSL
jgi:hypothetical protein